MYDHEYVQAWIRNYESGKDFYRVKYLEPHLQQILFGLPPKIKILDIGCGWGTILKYLQTSHEYYGVDIADDFFEYIHRTSSHPNITLQHGSLPNDLPVPDESFDLGICSMVLHTVADLDQAIETCFKKIKLGGKLIIIDFNDKTEKMMMSDPANSLDEKRTGYIRGEVVLASGIGVKTEVYFHKEEEFERSIEKYCSYEKKAVGPLFVSYECVKK
ncbi:MAG: class I SAM-dependent methyltransferase [Patescibacteria group bacterium]|nr:class I SAM-dependent methyltransferase [Patescibacteria group bacterium]